MSRTPAPAAKISPPRLSAVAPRNSLFEQLDEASKRSNPHKRKTLPLFTAEYGGDLAAYARAFFAVLFEYLKTPDILILDDYQSLPKGNEFHPLLAGLAEALPEGCRILVFICLRVCGLHRLR